MKANPLITAAAGDRHTECCTTNFCAACGAHVSTYDCSAEFMALRPESDEWEWWCACDNADCIHAYGEGLFQDRIAWISREADKTP